MLQIIDASYRYPSGNEGLKRISLRLKCGERLCLLGANGSGKSTLLRLAAGIVKPETGCVLINDLPAEEYSETGFIFQNPEDQIIAGAVDQELAFALENRAVDRAEMQNRVNDVAVEFELSPLLRRHPLSLSAGEKQRLALASTFIVRPRLLLLDEPTSFLDLRGRQTLFNALRAQTDLSIIVATQYSDEIDQFERVVFLDKGAIAFDGSVAQFKQSRLFSEITRSETLPSASPAPSITPGDHLGLEIDHVTFAYADGANVLQDVSAKFLPVQITAILGNSGSGKTTLAKILCGQERPATGRVSLMGTAAGSQELLDRVALVLQFPESAIFAETVFDEIAFGLRNAGASSDVIARAVEESLHLVGLEIAEFRDRSPHNLSAGEKRRIAIASMLVLNRPILLFDEITAGLDWSGVEAMNKLLFSLKQRGNTVIVISHDERFIERISDQTLILEEGKLRKSRP